MANFRMRRGTKDKLPRGYVPAVPGDRIPATDLIWYDHCDNTWNQAHPHPGTAFIDIISAADVGAWAKRRNKSKGAWAKRRNKSKRPKLHTWSPYELGIGPKDTKNLMLIRAQALMDAANQLGTENAKLKNTIATLRKKVSK